VEIAEHMISCGSRNTALIIGAEKLSSITDWQDRTTCVLFGDGAGAVVLRPSPEGCGIVNTHMGSDGSLCSLLHVPAGGSRRPATEETVKQRLHYMRMNGKEVFKYAVRAMADSVARVLDHTRLTLDDVDCIIPHQANIRIIDAIRERLGVAPEKFFCNLDRYGNMSAASIPVALDEAVRCGRIKKHDIVLMVAFGGGFTWGATVLEW
jgi:3-oxoacyl-[acyl-carrier-protein] synthase-3